jgi:hypothetical protein
MAIKRVLCRVVTKRNEVMSHLAVTQLTCAASTARIMVDAVSGQLHERRKMHGPLGMGVWDCMHGLTCTQLTTKILAHYLKCRLQIFLLTVSQSVIKQIGAAPKPN